MKRIAVLASGNGTNLQAIIDAVESKKICGAEVVLVLSDKKDAYALTRAKKHGIKNKFFDPQLYASRQEYDRALVAYLQEHKIDLVVLAGYMRLVSPEFVEAYKNRIMNIHPALLPAFPGTKGIAAALDYGVKVTGCTVHFVDEGMDTGPIILQEAVTVRDDDTVESLRERIQKIEHRLYPKAIDLWVRGKITIQGRRCFIDE
ncbi:MAG: phosphoribosylglycinamide formyltransferase [Firmicutes bacterium]|nr:phosphoribosylglycinamide formyltransferase [Bacillota bacterium]